MAINIQDTVERALSNWGVGTIASVLSDNRTQILKWFENFPPNEREIVAHLVQRLHVVTPPEMDAAMTDIVQDLQKYLKGGLTKACLLPMGLSLGDSGAQFIYSFHQRLSDGSRQLIWDGKLEEAADKYETIILVDDLVGSGGQAISKYHERFKVLKARFIYTPIYAFENGIDNITRNAGYEKIIPGKLLREHDRAFADNSTIFPEQTLRSELQEICQSYGLRLYPIGPLGYEDTQALMAFPHNCPNNTLPVIWAGPNTDETDERWHPLRVRRKFSAMRNKECVRASHTTQLLNDQPGEYVVKFNSLSPKYKSAYAALSLLGANAHLETIQTVCRLILEPTDVASFLETVENSGFLRNISIHAWQLNYIPDHAILLLDEREKTHIPHAIVSLLIESLRSGPESRLALNEVNIQVAFQTIAVFDAFGYLDARRNRIAGLITKYLETFGNYRVLVRHLEYEASSFKPQSEELYWNKFSLSRALYFLGEIRFSLDSLSDLYHELAELTLSDSRRSYRLNEIKSSCVRLLCQILADLGHPLIAVKILDRLISETDVSNLSHTVAMQNMQMFSWTLACSNLSENALLICDDIIEANYKGFLSPITLAVLRVHKARALIGKGNADEATALLSAPVEFFRRYDLRACAWALCLRSRAYLVTEAFDLATADMLEIVKIVGRSQIITADIVELFHMGLSDARCSLANESINIELSTFGLFRGQLQSVSGAILKDRFLEHVCLELDLDLEDEFIFSGKRYKLLTPQSHPAMDTVFMRTFLDAEIASDKALENKLDHLFLNYGSLPEIIFSNPLFNNLIVELCKKHQLLNKKYIYPHIQIVLAQYGGIRLFYARYFELIGDLDNAEKLLALVSNKRSFAFLNVQANVVGRRNCSDGLALNKQLLERMPEFFRQQRARIYNNMALLIHNNRLVDMYSEAISYCELSIANNRNPQFNYPKNMLLTLRLEQAAVDKIEAIIETHLDRFRPRVEILESAIHRLWNTSVRKPALRYIGKKKGQK